MTLIAVMLLSGQNAMAQRTVQVKDFHYTYRCGTENYTLKEATRQAIEAAQVEAIAEAFGREVISEVEQIRHNEGNSFTAVSTTRVRGRWEKTTKEPQIDISQSTSDLYVINVVINGKIRERKRANIDWLDAKLLRGHTDDRYESSTFISGDTCYISLRSTCDGYVAVYLLPFDERAYCLAPSLWQHEANIKIAANKRHILLKGDTPDQSISLICADGRKEELNEMYIVFSPNKFSKPIDNDDDGLRDFKQPRWISEQAFRQWLQKLQADDEYVCVKRSMIKIKNVGDK